MASIIDLLFKNKVRKDLAQDMKVYFENLVEFWDLSKSIFHQDESFVAKHQSVLTQIETQIAIHTQLIATDIADWDVKKIAKEMHNTKYEISWMRREWSNWKTA